MFASHLTDYVATDFKFSPMDQRGAMVATFDLIQALIDYGGQAEIGFSLPGTRLPRRSNSRLASLRNTSGAMI